MLDVNAIVTPRTGRLTQKVVVINGDPEMLELLESVLDAGHYDTVFVAEAAHAYSQVKRHRPQLVVLCVALDDPMGFQVLSMLKLDPDTASIPVLTYTADLGGERTDREPDDDDPDEDEQLPLVQPRQQEYPMN